MPTMEDLEQSLWCMKDHDIANRVLEIPLSSFACGEDCKDWREVRELLLRVFRNSVLSLTIYVFDEELMRMTE